MADPAELSDKDVARSLGRKTVSKLALVLIGESMYERDSDGVWYRLSDEQGLSSSRDP